MDVFRFRKNNFTHIHTQNAELAVARWMQLLAGKREKKGNCIQFTAVNYAVCDGKSTILDEDGKECVS